MNAKILAAVAAAAAVGLAGGVAQAGATFDAVKAKGFVQCGVNTGLPGFSAPDSTGAWTGIDVDICRATAAAVFGDATKVKYTPLTAQQRFTALQSGEIDVLSRNTTWTLTRDTALGLNFPPTIFYDGQGFLVAKSLGIKSVKELDGAAICVQTGTTTELNLADYFRTHGLKFTPVVIEKEDEVVRTFFSGRCDAFTSDTSQLAGVRSSVAPKPEDYVVLPEVISKEPLGPAVRHGDDQWFDVVKWTIYAMLEAEEKGITSKNVDEFLTSKDPTVQRLLGITPGMGKALGVDEKWAYNVIKEVGNYSEIYERNVGSGSPLKLERGLNALWTAGGLMYAPPIR
ncbi:MAG: transporter substrate-binding domain-containing protein [Azospirillum sp.]|nr:transporter substrate-binding domain-containing protein [Azospirillum sp.]